MNQAIAPVSLHSLVFPDDEPVLQSHPLLPGVTPPPFGQPDRWRFDATRRPANIAPSGWVAVFNGFDPAWNLRIREICMAMLNPRHPALETAGVDIGRDPYAPNTLPGVVSALRQVRKWAIDYGMPAQVAHWTSGDMQTFVKDRGETLSTAMVRNYVGVIRKLHQLAPILTGGGLLDDPWPGRSARVVAEDRPRTTVSTKNIHPGIWFPLIRAAWTYIDTFAPDILRARDTYQRLLAEAHQTARGADDRLRSWLADPANQLPQHHPHSSATTRPDGVDRESINWKLLWLLSGTHPSVHHGEHLAELKELALSAAAGRVGPASLIGDLRQVEHADGSVHPWSPGLAPFLLARECRALRAACYVFVAALSMMRDSEIRDITRGSVVGEYYGAPAVVSTKRKLDPGHPREHWWITEPVAKAILVIEQLSRHESLVFADPGIVTQQGPSESRDYANSRSKELVRSFIKYVNAHRGQTGLDEIPDGHVAPHMFRKTMAMLAGTRPGSEIALGIQLKHVAARALANRVTQAYAASDREWKRHLDAAVDETRFQRLRDFYDRHHAGETIGYGPGADKLTSTFDAIKEEAATTRRAVSGDRRVEYDLLRKANISLRFGKLNHCAFDGTSLAEANCLRDATIPPGHQGPLIDRCQPGLCANSVIGTEHLPIWRSEEQSLLTLIDTTPKLAAPRKESLQQQLHAVRTVLRRTEK